MQQNLPSVHEFPIFHNAHVLKQQVFSFCVGYVALPNTIMFNRWIESVIVLSG